jgi:4-amino-4-deoxy-L-arabinose transferase-like glycosyltransferase
MPAENPTLLEWLTQLWRTPRWQRTIRLTVAFVLAILGVLSLAIAFHTGNWVLLLGAAVFFLLWGLRVEVPDQPLTVISAETPPSTVPEKGISAEPAGQTPAAPVRPTVDLLRLIRLPLAVCFALAAQYVLDSRPNQTNVDQNLWPGVFLYGVALAFTVWSVFAGDFPLKVAVEGRGTVVTKVARQRVLLVIGALVFGLLAYGTLTGGMYNLVSLLLLGLALFYWLMATAEYPGSLFDALRVAAGTVAGKFRALAGNFRKGIVFSPWTLLVTVCFLGLVAYRTVNLNSIPPGMTDDHAEKLLNIVDIFEGRPYIFFATNGGREALHFYFLALIIKVFGTGLSFLSLHIASVIVGILTLPVMYLLGRELFDRRVGLLAMLLTGFGYWPDMISRIGLRLPHAMLFTALTLLFFLRALRRRRWNDFLWAGVALGIGLYGYTPIRLVPVVMGVALLLFLLHPSSKGSRAWATGGAMLSILTAVLLFIPMLRYMLEFPKDFWLRTVSRMVPETGGLPNPLEAFWHNLVEGLKLFNWNDGGGWFNCIPNRPALDIVTGGLFLLGIFLLIAQFARRRSWESLFLVLSPVLLILPSVLALAEPVNNPSLARANAAVAVTYLFPALSLVVIIDFVKSLVSGRTGILAGALIVAALMIPVLGQNSYLTQVVYPGVYRGSAQNESEIGAFIKEFAETVGSYKDAHFIPYPYWVGDRLVNLYAGLPINHQGLVVWQDDLEHFEFTGRPTLFLLKDTDDEALSALQATFPEGTWKHFSSAFPGKDFIAYSIPGRPGEQAAP